MIKSKINLKEFKKDLKEYQNKEKAKILAWFFKTGKGEYGEGDFFLGIMVPDSRKMAQKYAGLSFDEIKKLFESKFHEERLIALLILVHNYRKGDQKIKKKIFDFYLTQTKYINNWDLVDLSAGYIVGDYLLDKNRSILKKLAKSKNIWERRIAIISTFAFIYKNESKWTFKITRILMKDKHDLIHKACGWMLREVGKRVSEKDLEAFLKENISQMPRTMLRYSIERFLESKRKMYLNKKN